MHGSSKDSCDPNLVPLLDLVLQLIMFFIMVVNFVAEQINTEIKLPSAQSARPLDNKKVQGALFINMDKQGEITVPGEPKPFKSIPEMRFFLRKCFEDASRLAHQLGEKSVTTVVIVRADQQVDSAYVYYILRICKEVGFRRFQLRADTGD